VQKSPSIGGLPTSIPTSQHIVNCDTLAYNKTKLSQLKINDFI
jgi:hypothetical protein